MRPLIVKLSSRRMAPNATALAGQALDELLGAVDADLPSEEASFGRRELADRAPSSGQGPGTIDR
ncbi:MAG: hypothetical protein PVG92_07335 [Holophagae bacterium]